MISSTQTPISPLLLFPSASPPLQRDEKDQLADSVRGDVVTSLLPVVDNFELARTQVKAETEAEQKINNSYQVSRPGTLIRPRGRVWCCRLLYAAGPRCDV